LNYGKKLNCAISGFGGALLFPCTIETRHPGRTTSVCKRDRWP
jgi:hypothetical protein